MAKAKKADTCLGCDCYGNAKACREKGNCDAKKSWIVRKLEDSLLGVVELSSRQACEIEVYKTVVTSLIEVFDLAKEALKAIEAGPGKKSWKRRPLDGRVTTKPMPGCRILLKSESKAPCTKATPSKEKASKKARVCKECDFSYKANGGKSYGCVCGTGRKRVLAAQPACQRFRLIGS